MDGDMTEADPVTARNTSRRSGNGKQQDDFRVGQVTPSERKTNRRRQITHPSGDGKKQHVASVR
ncbi:hypothetical protein J6590_062931 [Homalodisca vitripennis]|nr:hypothetical protein J6590_062931 [Homalodisca vitripennis]